MGVRNPNSTSYVHPDEPNLLNLHKAMEYDVDGVPHVRVSLGSDNITVSGNVNVLDAVRVNNTEAQMIPVYLVGNVLTVNQGTNPWVVTGNANVSVIGNVAGITTLPAITGNVNVNNFPSNVSITQLPGISIVSLPEVEIKNDTGNAIAISKNNTVNSSTNRIYVSMETDAVVADSNYYMNVARGLVPGHSSVERSAYMPATPSTETSIWVEGGIYPHGTWTSAGVLYIASSSEADTNLDIFVEGLDSNYNYQSENVFTNASNGTTTVTTTKQYIRIYTATVVSASSNSSNAGDIRFRITSASGTVVAHIGPSLGVTKLSQYTVPAGHTGYIQYGDVATFKNGAGNQSGLVKMMVRPFGGAFVAAFMAQVSNGYYRNDFTVPLPVPAKADVDVRILTDSTGATVSSNYQLILIPN